MSIKLEVGTQLIVFIPMRNSSYIMESVEVTALHSGYYDDQFTGITPEGRTIYFNEEDFLQSRAHVGRYADAKI